MVGYIYKTTNKVNGFVYIGQHQCNFFDRKYRGSGSIFRQALEEHGWDNFTTELVCWAETMDKLNELEVLWIDAHKGQKMYNLSNGGNGGAKYIYVDLQTNLIYLGVKSAAKAAGVGVTAFNRWVNVGGNSKGLMEHYENNKNPNFREKPKYLWITHRWVRLKATDMLKMKNPIFA